MNTHARTHARTHALTHARTHARARARTHTHKQVMGRDCGWLTAATAKMYRDDLKCQNMVPAMGLSKVLD